MLLYAAIKATQIGQNIMHCKWCEQWCKFITRKSLPFIHYQVEATMIALVTHQHVDRVVVNLKTESE